MKRPDPWRSFEYDRPGRKRPRRGFGTLRRMLHRCWCEARLDYKAAGAPFGPSQRGIEVWVHYSARTTIN